MPVVSGVEKQLLFNPDRCIGCKSCAAACYLGHLDTPALCYEELPSSTAMPMVCRHCDEAPCVSACPRDAMYKDEDGVVRRSAVRCTGCRSCALACPFGVLDEEVTRGQIAKCDLCVDRTEREDSPLLPRCVSVCPSGALQFMDLAEEVEEEGYVVLSGRVISSSG